MSKGEPDFPQTSRIAGDRIGDGDETPEIRRTLRRAGEERPDAEDGRDV